MRNRRLMISALALALMTGCSADTTVNPEILDFVGTWEVVSWVYTSVDDMPTKTATDTLRRGHLDRSCIPALPPILPEPGCNLADSLGVPTLEPFVSYIVFYDDNDVLFLTHYVDTVSGTPMVADSAVVSDFDAFEWCVALANDDHDDHFHADEKLGDCLAAGGGDLIIDEEGQDELYLRFVRTGDNMTISSHPLSALPLTTGGVRTSVEYAFDPDGMVLEPATFVITLERIILDIPRGDLTCPGQCDLGT